MKYVSLDIETTGLDAEHCHPIEFGAIIDDLQNQKPYEECEKFHCYLLPKGKTFYGEPFALALNSEILYRIANRSKPENVIHKFLGVDFLAFQFQAWLDTHGFKGEGVTIAGKNAASFDLPFLKRTVAGFSGIKLRHRVIDPGNLFVDLSVDTELPNSKVCLERAGLTATDAHTALGDAWDVVRLVRFAQAQKRGLLEGAGALDGPIIPPVRN